MFKYLLGPESSQSHCFQCGPNHPEEVRTLCSLVAFIHYVERTLYNLILQFIVSVMCTVELVFKIYLVSLNFKNFCANYPGLLI